MKPVLAISCPATSRSGYGDHSRDLIRSLINTDKFDIKILDQRWGDCPQDALTEDDRDIHDLIHIGQLQSQPDIWIQVTVATEFSKVGKYNIGITAGVETTLCSKEFLDGCNRMDWVLVPSEFSKAVIMNTKFDKMDNGVKTATYGCTTKVDVLFEGLDTEIYNKTSDLPASIVKTLDDIDEDFCYLVCGHWVHGDYGHDRKDIGRTIHTFIRSFKDKAKQNRPALVLKSSSATFSITDRETLLKKIDQIKNTFGTDNLPEIYLLHGDLSKDEMNGLYNHPKIKAMLSFTHGEGFGRPLLEFSITGKPILVSGWSGHMDFMKEYGILLPGELKKLDKTSLMPKILIPESQWFYVDCDKAIHSIRDVYKNYKKYLEKTRKQTQYVKDNWTIDKMDKDFEKLISENVPSLDTFAPKFDIPTLEEIQTYD
tara:strand:- start:690 stop:1970 length:1281 start_codon:yes stop_codon:yes gene_type:complete